MPFTIAIDGPAASGKGTIARALAAHYGFAHLDTGLLYRAVGARGGDPVAAARALEPADLARPGLRTAEAGIAASIVAAIPEVRAALVDFQRRFAAQEPGAILDGRDIGTAICPHAEVKLYVIADDRTRAATPLRPAPDAVFLDTTTLTIDEAIARAVAEVEARMDD